MGRTLREWWVIIVLSLLFLGANGLLFFVGTDLARTKIPDEVARSGLGFVGLLGSAITFVAGLIMSSKSERRRTMTIARTEIERKLESAIDFFFSEESRVQIRSNVMLARKDRLKIICSCNMNAFPDKDLELGIRQGCAGMAWFHEEAVVAPDLEQTEHPYWGLTEDQRGKTSHVKWVVSTPIKHSSSRDVIGIFNLDGLGTLREPSILSRDNEEFLGHCHGFAGSLGRIIEEYKMI